MNASSFANLMIAAIGLQANEGFLHQLVRLVRRAPTAAQKPAKPHEQGRRFVHALKMARTEGPGQYGRVF